VTEHERFYHRQKKLMKNEEFFVEIKMRIMRANEKSKTLEQKFKIE
jgi:hypothetical protein